MIPTRAPGSFSTIGVSSPVVSRQLVPALLASLLTLACADRVYDLPADMKEAETEFPAPGEPFFACMDSNECFDEWCLHPVGEPGFCTYVCSGAADCEAVDGGTATATCLPVGGDHVCALDCGDNRSCPLSMRCEQIEANGQPRSICF